MLTNDKYIIQKEKSKGHRLYRHYTSIDALTHIFKGKCFRLTCLSSPRFNDPLEGERLDQFANKTIFGLSFTHANKETIPLWKMYTPDSKGVCIETKSLAFLENVGLYPRIPSGWEIRALDALDMLYTDEDVYYEEEPIPGFSRIKHPYCQGFVKKTAWKFEKETRIRCCLERDGGRISQGYSDKIEAFDRKKGKFSTENIYPGTDYLYCTIPEIDLLTMKIIFHPNMAEPVKEMIRGGICSILPQFPMGNFRNSDLEGKIRL